MKYYIGIDGGGTKTAFSLCNGEGEQIATYLSTGSSYMMYGIDHVVECIRLGVGQCLQQGNVSLTDVAGISMGLPCIGENVVLDLPLKEKIHASFPGVPVYIGNDVEVGWAGSLACEEGINVVAGTGSIAFGKDHSGKTARSGGWAEFFSDEGSCYWAGRKTLELFSKESDYRLQKSALHDVICEEFHLTDDYQIIDIMFKDYFPYREKVASLQILLEKAAVRGDPNAIQAYRSAAEELALIVKGVLNQLDFPEGFPVSYSGGLFKAGDLILKPFESQIHALGGILVKPALPPVMGAVLLCFSKFNPSDFSAVSKTIRNRETER
nr:BadF/BadG/BcrA/BcrD ATPase family protein [uncultured Caproiciproducens sp.]